MPVPVPRGTGPGSARGRCGVAAGPPGHSRTTAAQRGAPGHPGSAWLSRSSSARSKTSQSAKIWTAESPAAETDSGVFAPRPPAATAARRLSGPGRGREDQAAGLSCVWGRGTGQQGGRPREQKGRRPVNAQTWADLRARSGTGGGGEGSPHWRGTAAEPQRAAPRPPGRRPCRTRSQRPGGPRVPALPLARRASGERAPRGRSVPWTALGCHTVPETAARF